MAELGVFVGNNPTGVYSFETWLGREVDGVLGFIGQASWTDFTEGARWAADNLWSQIDRPIYWSVPLIVEGASLDQAAAGAYDGYWRSVAQQLADTRPQDEVIYVRTGWEFNGNWMPWAAKGNEQAFIEAFRGFVDVFRSVSDRFVFEWNVNIGDMGMNPADAYPGDAWVDIIGMDFYWNTRWDPSDPDQAWNYMVNRKYGLQWLEDFAAARSKPTAYSEWGVMSDNAGSYLEKARAWFESHDVVYQNYWNSDYAFAGSLTDGSYPNAAEAYRKLFSAPTVDGGGGTVTPPPPPPPTGLVVLDLATALSGALGAQAWGTAKVSAADWSGKAVLVTKAADGLGVAGGRFDGQVDHNPSTGASEVLRVDFAAGVDSAVIRLGRVGTNESGGKVEIASWKAYDAAGALVGQGVLDPRQGVAAGGGYDFAIDPAADFQRLEIRANPYSGGSSGSGESSDVSLLRIAYEPSTQTTTGSNRAPTVNGPLSVSVAENSAVGTVVADVNGSDADGDALRYAFVSGYGGGGAFSIDAATGVIRVADPSKLDFENASLDGYALRVAVTDGRGGSAVADVAVTVTDVPETGAATVIGLGDALGGGIGSQSWGGLKVSAADWSGKAALVTKAADGLGVAGGRFDGQTDYNPSTGASETLRLNFGAAVDSATIRLGRMSPTEGGAEMGAWKAYDAAGTLVGQGALDPREGVAAGTGYDFTIDTAADFTRIVLTARPYADGTTVTYDSSDFSVQRVAYWEADAAL